MFQHVNKQLTANQVKGISLNVCHLTVKQSKSFDSINLLQQLLTKQTMSFGELVDAVRQCLLFLLCTYMGYLIYTLLKDLLLSKANKKRSGVALKSKPAEVAAEDNPAPAISVTEVKDPEPAPVTEPHGKEMFDVDIREVDEPVAPVTSADKAEASGKSRRRNKGETVKVQSTSAAPGVLQAAPEGTADAPKTLSRKCKHGNEDKSKTLFYQIPSKLTPPVSLPRE